MDKRIERNRQQARDAKRAEILEWYLGENSGKAPEYQCEDKKAYLGKVLWWLEPLLPGNNPVLIEEYVGDYWTLRIDFGRPS